MYYEEKVIEGKLYSRTDPNGEWSEVSPENVVKKYDNLKKERAKERAQIEEAKQELQEKLKRLEQLAMDCVNSELF